MRVRERYLHIDGEWRDHVTYALTAEELDAPLADRFEQRFRDPGVGSDRTRQANPGSG